MHHTPTLQCLKTRVSSPRDSEWVKAYNVLKDEALIFPSISSNGLKEADIFAALRALLSLGQVKAVTMLQKGEAVHVVTTFIIL